jgi:hypothetical protein
VSTVKILGEELVMKRKTSTVPSVVFKYGLSRPTANAELVEETFTRSTSYYNALVDVENGRRDRYRAARRKHVPVVAALEQQLDETKARVKQLAGAIKETKKTTRSRKVPAELAAEMKVAKTEKKTVAAALRAAVAESKSCVALRSDAEQIDTEACETAKKLRETLYWGTYLLVEDAFTKARKASPFRIEPKLEPDEKQHGRIGIQIQGGVSPAELATDSRVQLDVPNIERAGMKPFTYKERRPRGVLRLRVGTVPGKRDPIWAEFPVTIHRPLPDDAKIMWVVVTRRPGHMYKKWIYSLCLTIESRKFSQVVRLKTQVGTTAINFGWRKTDDGLRVATVNNDARSPEHVVLPEQIYQRFDKCSDLRSIMDKQFDDVKKTLGLFIRQHREELPIPFLDSFQCLGAWRSKERLSNLVNYWREHRVSNDSDVFCILWAWRGKWIHLQQWEMCNYQKALGARTDFYRRTALQIAQNSSTVAIEDFKMDKIVRKNSLPAEVEVEGGDLARENRTRASIYGLKTYIKQAATKCGDEIVLVKAQNNTRRCNVCGKLIKWDPARELVHDCPDCSTWDQDVNNTDNVLDRIASGEVATLVGPPVVNEDKEVTRGRESSVGVARAELHRKAKELENQDQP